MSIDLLIKAAQANAPAKGISTCDVEGENNLRNFAIFSRTHPELIELVKTFQNVADDKGNRMVVATRRGYDDGRRTLALAFEDSKGVPYGNVRISFNGFVHSKDVRDVITKDVVGNKGFRPEFHYIGHGYQAAHACNEVWHGLLETTSGRATALFVAAEIGKHMPTHPVLLSFNEADNKASGKKKSHKKKHKAPGMKCLFE